MEGLWASVDTRSSEGYCYAEGLVGVCEIDHVVQVKSPWGDHVCQATNAIISHVNVSRDVCSTAY